jgi:hypothetical protein
VTDQLKVELPPLLTLVGLALKAIVGIGEAVVVTVADCAAVPPPPVQVRVYLVVAVSAGVALVPVIGCVPLQPPEAVHEVAFVELQLSVAVFPLTIVAGLAVRVIDGAGLVIDTDADWEEVPPAPVQLRPKVAFAVSAPVL